MSEEVRKDAAAEETAALNKNELIAALEGEFATGVNKILINSVGKEYAFREVSVKEQKALTRIMSGNENRKDVIYDAQCALINEAALDKSFDIYDYTEFDRMKVLIALYQENMFQNEVKFTCEECGTENRYRVDFTKTLEKLDSYKLEQKALTYENKRFRYDFEFEYPSVKLVSAFHRSYCAKTGTNVPKRMVKSNNVISNLEYVNLFIRGVKILNKQTGSERQVSFRSYKVSDIEDILQAFPQDALYSDTGALKYIVSEYLKPVNESFDKHVCAKCKAVHNKEGANNPESFF